MTSTLAYYSVVRGRLSTVDLLIKTGCFVKKIYVQYEKQLIRTN